MDVAERNKQMVADLTMLADAWKLVADESPAPERKPRRKPAAPRTRKSSRSVRT
jgi:hypothetical protein